MAGVYFTTVSAPTITAGFFVRPETRMLIGTLPLYQSLEVTSYTYLYSYDANVGLQAGASFDVGQVADLSWQHKPEFAAVEGFNVIDDSIWEVTGEETMLTVEIQELNPRILELAVGTGVMYTIGVERLITFGGGCTLRNRPVSLEWTNEACGAPDAADAASGISGGVLTLYDCFIVSGLEWSMNAKETNTIPLELQARPVLTKASGNRLGNLYLW